MADTFLGDARDLPLRHIRVLDVSTAIAAPVAATMLADFGADVVKVEQPGVGDYSRSWGSDDVGDGRSDMWLQEARNRRSVTINLKTAEGQALLRSLVPEFDVVVTNYKPGTLEKWGLAPEQLRALNPRAVLLVITGYGLTGPYSDRGAFDRIASAFSGLTYVSGEPDRHPVRSGYAVIDYMTGYLGAFSVMMALYHRDLHNGSGQLIDLALYEAGFRASEYALQEYARTGKVRSRTGNRSPHVVPASDFTTADGKRVSVHAGTNPLFKRMMSLINRPDLADDSRLATGQGRATHSDEIYAVLEEWMATQKADEVVGRLNDAGIPSSIIMSIADIAENPHYWDRGTLVNVLDEQRGEIPMVAPLPRLSETPGSIRSLGPLLGEHTDQVLHELLGTSSAEVEELRAKGIV